MKTNKLIKKINKAVEKTPSIKSALAKTNDDVMSFHVNAKNKQAFRFFRDLFDGTLASEINHVYGCGGRMTVDLAPHSVRVILYTNTNQHYNTYELICETQVAQPG